MVKLLLQDPRVDPITQNSELIRWVCMNNNMELVKLLLQDPRFNPSDQNNKVVRYASQCGHLMCVHTHQEHA